MAGLLAPHCCNAASVHRGGGGTAAGLCGDLQLALKALRDHGGAAALAVGQPHVQCVKQPGEEVHRVGLLLDGEALPAGGHDGLHELVRRHLPNTTAPFKSTFSLKSALLLSAGPRFSDCVVLLRNE